MYEELKLLDGIYISDIYSTLLQKNTLQLNKFLSQLEKDDWICLLENQNDEISEEILENFDSGKHIELFLFKFPNIIISKVYKARFHDFKLMDSEIIYKMDYNDLFMFYTFSNNLENLLLKINEESLKILNNELDKETNGEQ